MVPMVVIPAVISVAQTNSWPAKYNGKLAAPTSLVNWVTSERPPLFMDIGEMDMLAGCDTAVFIETGKASTSCVEMMSDELRVVLLVNPIHKVPLTAVPAEGVYTNSIDSTEYLP